VFYTSSEGGVTLSGGEPLDQAEFAYQVLAECKRRGLHTAIETTLFTARATLERFLAVTDLFLTDLKIWDPQVHKETVGVDNALIKDNILYLAQNGVDLVIRMPLIPEITATAENIRPIAAFVRDLPGNVPFELINFNPLASGKYRILDRNYAFESYTSPYAQEEYNEFIAVAAEQGGRVLASG
jgi:pyruvate formate lyase activating enzyme